MIEIQTDVNKKTIELNAKKLERDLTRADLIELRKIVKSETDLRKKAEEIIAKLEGEDAHVFGGVLRSVSLDMRDVIELLEDQDTGKYTQTLESEILDQLESLVKALQKEQETRRKQQQQQGGGGGGGGKKPLIPPVAELKMLRHMERGVREKTSEIDQALKQTGKQPNLIQKKMINRLAHKQGQVTEMTEKMREALLKQQQQQGAPPGQGPGR
jgi:hypothetical protein